MNQSNRSAYIIAGSVLFAGLLIAAGVFFGGNGKTGQDSTADKNSGNGNLVTYAEAAGIDTEEFQSCLDSDKFQSEVQSDIKDARSSISKQIGTPFNVLILDNPLTDKARSRIDSQFGSSDNFVISEDGKRIAISGAFPFDPLKQVIDQAISGQKGSGDRSSEDISINPVNKNDYIRGSKNAKVAIVEYSDFKCPYCQQFHQTMKQIMDEYEDGKVAWVLRQMPIKQLHPEAPRLARASECVADLGGGEAFWTFADEVFASGN